MYVINNVRIQRVLPQACHRLAQYGKGQPITCRCSRCTARGQTPEQALASVKAASAH